MSTPFIPGRLDIPVVMVPSPNAESTSSGFNVNGQPVHAVACGLSRTEYLEGQLIGRLAAAAVQSGVMELEPGEFNEAIRRIESLGVALAGNIVARGESRQAAQNSN